MSMTPIEFAAFVALTLWAGAGWYFAIDGGTETKAHVAETSDEDPRPERRGE